MAARKTAAQKAAEAAEREEYTHYDDTEAPTPDEAKQDAGLSTVRDEKSGKFLTIQQLKNKLRNEAEREVLDKHKAEVVAITAAKYDKHGLQYVRRLSEEEKAQKQIEELYEKFPNLRPQEEQQQAQQENGEDVVDELIADGLVEAVPDGPLATFRTGEHEVVYEGPDPSGARY